MLTVVSCQICKPISGSNSVILITLVGEGRIPSNWCRDLHWDESTFFALYPMGRFGMNHPRQVKINKFDFCSQRFLNFHQMYAKDTDYVFCCQQLLERHLVENNISVKLKKGRCEYQSDGSTKIKSSNAFDVFSKIPGTPAYWQIIRFEMFAKMDTFGPFHFFFTLSAAEKKWPEVTSAILHYEEIEDLEKVVYEDGWEYDSSKIKFYFKGWQHFKEKENEKIKTAKSFLPKDSHKFFKSNYMLITRIFDSRVKSFLSNILCANMDVEHYSYRIEFQVRGMPHLHGVFWLTKESLRRDGYMNHKNEFIDHSKLEGL